MLTQQTLNAALVVAAVAASVALALWQRRNPATHKRLMWPSAIILQSAGSGRLLAWLGVPGLTLPLTVGLALSNVVYDLVILRRAA